MRITGEGGELLPAVPLMTVDTYFNKKRQITHFPFEAVCFTVDTSDITIDQHICMSTERSSLHLPVADWSLLVQI